MVLWQGIGGWLLFLLVVHFTSAASILSSKPPPPSSRPPALSTPSITQSTRESTTSTVDTSSKLSTPQDTSDVELWSPTQAETSTTLPSTTQELTPTSTISAVNSGVLPLPLDKSGSPSGAKANKEVSTSGKPQKEIPDGGKPNILKYKELNILKYEKSSKAKKESSSEGKPSRARFSGRMENATESSTADLAPATTQEGASLQKPSTSTPKASPTSLGTSKVPSADSTTTKFPKTSTVATTVQSFLKPTKVPPPGVTEPEYYQEKVKSLGCRTLPLPSNASIWKANQTHELNLPNKNFKSQCSDGSCSEWDGVRDMQSGDVLLVRIDDAQLIREPSKDPRATVYQVTRGGRDNCDITEGVMLDISPLQSEEKTLVALYDRDLTEGANMLIIVSESWGDQCVRLSVTVKSDNCGDDQDCSGKGLCFSNDSMESYECQCCTGFIGPHCEEKDACYPSPCKNNGICVDISQGHDGNTYQCLCPYGFTGKTCEDTSDPCESGPCQNGGSCSSSNLTAQQFKCLCLAGFSGSLCQHNLDDCASNPCGHGICVDQADGYRCYCQPGFSGEQCQLEYNECESSPCLNGGTCTDHIGRFTCSCGKGYTGQRCQIKVDLCDPNPCSHHHYCIDKGNTFSCECPQGFTGANCGVPGIVSCSHNPCLNGGTCWSSIDSFYCSCLTSFTGQICNVELLVDESSSEVDGATILGEAEKSSLDLQMPISIHLDHLHSIYVAAGTLACALLIVIITVTVCHCKMHGTHKKIYSYLCKRKTAEDKKPNGFITRNRFIPPVDTKPPRKLYPCFDSSEMYYGLDFSDSQSSPLIQ